MYVYVYICVGDLCVYASVCFYVSSSCVVVFHKDFVPITLFFLLFIRITTWLSFSTKLKGNLFEYIFFLLATLYDTTLSVFLRLEFLRLSMPL